MSLPRIPWLIPLAALLIAALAVAAAPAQVVLSSQNLKWHTDANAAFTEAAATQRPLMMYLFNRSAAPCRDMEQKTFRDERITARLRDFTLLAIDYGNNPDAARAFNVIKVPTVIFWTPDKVELFRAVGYKPVQEFADYLAALPAPAAPGQPMDAISAAAAAAGTQLNYDPSRLILTPRPNTKKHTFYYYAPNAQRVELLGDFQNWEMGKIIMNRHESGYWWIDAYMFDGIYEYKFLVDGVWMEDPNARWQWPSPFEGNNSVLVVGRVPIGPQVHNGNVYFIYYNRDARKVEFAGSFNNWTRVPMFSKGDGNWGIAYPLPVGRYEYKFIVDDNWICDPENLNRTRSDGNQNSVLDLTNMAAMYAPQQAPAAMGGR